MTQTTKTTKTGRIVAFFAQPEDGSEPDWGSPSHFVWVSEDGEQAEASSDDWERAGKSTITPPYEDRDGRGEITGWHCGAVVASRKGAN